LLNPNNIPAQQELNGLSQTQRERLQFIDFQLYFFGVISRSQVVERFGIKEAAASRDIALYRQVVPDNCEYSNRWRADHRKDSFMALFEYFKHHPLVQELIKFSDSYTPQTTFIATPSTLNIASIDTLATVSRAINLKHTLIIDYLSLSSGKSQRQLAPYAIIDNGLRLHVRGYDRLRQRFSDFVLNRITKLTTCIDAPDDHETKYADIQWNRIVELQLVPHPRLKHKNTIAYEYSMQDERLTLQVRAAMAGYLLRSWNIDCSHNAKLQGPEHHLWLSNTATLYGVDNLAIAPGYQGHERMPQTSHKPVIS